MPGEIPRTPSSPRRAVALAALAVALLSVFIASWGSIAGRLSNPIPREPAAADRTTTNAASSSMVRAPISRPGEPGPAADSVEISSHADLAAAPTHAEKSQRRRQAATRAALRTVQTKIARLERARESADGARQQAEEQLRQQSVARARAEEVARNAQAQLASERAAKDKVERLAQQLRDQMQQAQMVPPPVAKKTSTAKPQTKAPKVRVKSPDQAADSMPGFIP